MIKRRLCDPGSSRPVCLLQSGKINSHKLTVETETQEVKRVFIVFIIQPAPFSSCCRQSRARRVHAIQQKSDIVPNEVPIVSDPTCLEVFLAAQTANSRCGTPTGSFRLAPERDWWPLAEVQTPAGTQHQQNRCWRRGQGSGERKDV